MDITTVKINYARRGRGIIVTSASVGSVDDYEAYILILRWSRDFRDIIPVSKPCRQDSKAT